MRRLSHALLATSVLTGAAALTAPVRAAVPPTPHNVILFVADGLRANAVDKDTAPTLNMIKKKGVFFQNSHSIFPTFTTPNASAMATGHYLGDTGDFSNTIYTGYPQPFANGTLTPFLENDQVLGDIDSHFAGTITDQNGNVISVGYLNEETILAAARAAGLSTAAIGKLGPAAIFDHQNSALVDASVRDTRGAPTIFVDDRTGSSSGIPLDPAFAAALTAAGVPTVAPGRGANGASGNNVTPGTLVANTVQQDYFVQVASNVVLPQFKTAAKPFVMVFWSRDPDGTQHNQGDSLNTVVPGINGPTSLAAIANADSDLSRLMDALERLGLTDTTDVIVTADHGFSTITKNSGPNFTPSATSFAATQTYQAYRSGVLTQEVPTRFLPPGFIAIDLSQKLGLKLYDPDSSPAGSPLPVTPASYPPVDPTQPPLADGTRLQRPAFGNGVLGADRTNPDVVVAANGGSDLIYLPNPATATTIAPSVIGTLLSEDYVSGIFVDDRLGSYPGTLPLSSINLQGTAITPIPTIVVNFASWSTKGQGCAVFDSDALCAVEVADTGLQQGQGMHGDFSRGDTFNFMAAMGPDFRTSYTDPVPASNADIGKTIAALLALDIPNNGSLMGRPLNEAFLGGVQPPYSAYTLRSQKSGNGLQTILKVQTVGAARYFDVAGFPGRSVGLK